MHGQGVISAVTYLIGSLLVLVGLPYARQHLRGPSVDVHVGVACGDSLSCAVHTGTCQPTYCTNFKMQHVHIWHGLLGILTWPAVPAPPLPTKAAKFPSTLSSPCGWVDGSG